MYSSRNEIKIFCTGTAKICLYAWLVSRGPHYGGEAKLEHWFRTRETSLLYAQDWTALNEVHFPDRLLSFCKRHGNLLSKLRFRMLCAGFEEKLRKTSHTCATTACMHAPSSNFLQFDFCKDKRVRQFIVQGKCTKGSTVVVMELHDIIAVIWGPDFEAREYQPQRHQQPSMIRLLFDFFRHSFGGKQKQNTTFPMQDR